MKFTDTSVACTGKIVWTVATSPGGAHSSQTAMRTFVIRHVPGGRDTAAEKSRLLLGKSDKNQKGPKQQSKGMTFPASQKKKDLLRTSEKELRKRLVKCFVWSVALYGERTWTLRRNEEKRIEAFEMWMWRRTVRVKWTDRIRNKIVFEKVSEERMMLKLNRKRKRN
ncbi:hypothetical protein ANN_24995 [Periplaneta americana]|uniref:Uncharacterized protein n=1 Tax=Periplaneta americana TaxID=6978 RepID=A0ABQ8S062_PERAM|nr:hypothetical protein ANN_24995 [Periplaneta americana]